MKDKVLYKDDYGCQITLKDDWIEVIEIFEDEETVTNINLSDIQTIEVFDFIDYRTVERKPHILLNTIHNGSTRFETGFAFTIENSIENIESVIKELVSESRDKILSDLIDEIEKDNSKDILKKESFIKAKKYLEKGCSYEKSNINNYGR